MDEIRDYYANIYDDGRLDAVEVENMATEFFDKYSFGNPVVKRWDFWSTYSGRMYYKNELDAESKSINFED